MNNFMRNISKLFWPHSNTKNKQKHDIKFVNQNDF